MHYAKQRQWGGLDLVPQTPHHSLSGQSAKLGTPSGAADLGASRTQLFTPTSSLPRRHLEHSGAFTQPPFTPPSYRTAVVTNFLTGRIRSATSDLVGRYTQIDQGILRQARFFSTAENDGLANWFSRVWGVTEGGPPAPAVSQTKSPSPEELEKTQRELDSVEAQRQEKELGAFGGVQSEGSRSATGGIAANPDGNPCDSEPIGSGQVAEAEGRPKWAEYQQKARQHNVLNLTRAVEGGVLHEYGALKPDPKVHTAKLEEKMKDFLKTAKTIYKRRLLRIQRERRGGLKATADRGLEQGLNEPSDGSLNRGSDVGTDESDGSLPLSQEGGARSSRENVHLGEGETRSPEGGVPRGEKRRGGQESVRSGRGRYAWRVVEHGLKDEQIPEAAWFVLRRLWEKGYEGYLAGGMVRDLLLGRTPKDIDIVSSALPNQVKRAVPGTMVFGRRFRLAQVTFGDTTIEVSSFGTISRPAAFKGDTCHEGESPGAIAEASRAKMLTRLKGRVGPGKHHLLESAVKRDITINSLLYDPFERVVYDFCGGMADIRNKRIRTIIDAEESFQEDPARVLRAIRIAARTDFHLTGELERAVARVGRAAVLSLGKSRLLLELNVMLSYGSAERSLALLWKTGLLEILLPLQAEYLAAKKWPRTGAPERGELLLELLRQLDNLTNPGAPCHGALWVALLALPLAAHRLKTAPVILLTLAKALSVHDPEQGIPLAYRRAKNLMRGFQERDGLAGRSFARPAEAERDSAERNEAERNGLLRDGVEWDGAEWSGGERNGTGSDGMESDGEIEEATALTERLAERADVIVCQMALANEATVRGLTGLATNKDLGGVMRLDAARASALFALVARRSSPEVVRYFDLLRRNQVKSGRSESNGAGHKQRERARKGDLKDGRLSDLADAVGAIVKEALASRPMLDESELQEVRERQRVQRQRWERGMES